MKKDAVRRTPCVEVTSRSIPVIGTVGHRVGRIYETPVAQAVDARLSRRQLESRRRRD